MAKDGKTESRFVVEAIAGHAFCEVSNKMILLVKWEGYSLDDCTWEFEEDLTRCYSLAQNYRSNREFDGYEDLHT